MIFSKSNTGSMTDRVTAKYLLERMKICALDLIATEVVLKEQFRWSCFLAAMRKVLSKALIWCNLLIIGRFSIDGRMWRNIEYMRDLNK